MPENMPMSLLEDIIEVVFGFFRGLAGLVESLSTVSVEQLGPYGLPALYLVGLVIVFLAVWGIVQFLFRILRYLVLPAIILALLGTLFLPYPFLTLLPFSAVGCSLILLLKG